jgi:hypothetical protein
MKIYSNVKIPLKITTSNNNDVESGRVVPLKKSALQYCVTKEINSQNYLLNSAKFVNHITEHTDIVLPIVVDTEFKTESLMRLSEEGPYNTSLHLTTQFKFLPSNETRTFISSEFEEHLIEHEHESSIRHPTLRSGFHVIDLLRGEGVDVELTHDPDVHKQEAKDALPVFRVLIYAFYALADVPKLFQGTFLDEFKQEAGRGTFENRRRMISKRRGSFQPGWYAPYRVALNGLEYRLIIDLVDASAIMGNATYAEYCKNLNISLTHKKDMHIVKDGKPPLIERMDEAYIEYPKIFDVYAEEDLKVYEMLEKFDQYMGAIYEKLGLIDYYQESKLTMGSTVNELIEAIIFKFMEFSSLQTDLSRQKKECLEPLTRRSSAEHIAQRTLTSVTTDKKKLRHNYHLLAKCDGGRCRNAKPTFISKEGSFFDVDLDGAYSTIMSQLHYPLGIPVHLTFYKTLLKKALSKFDKELVPRLWHARIKTREDLAYDQELIPSWYDETKERVTETYVEDGERKYRKYTALKVDSGKSRIFLNQIEHGILTSDILDVILTEWSPRQRKDFFNKVEIETLMFYPASLRVDTPQELLNTQKEHNKTKPYDFPITSAGCEMDDPTECHSWISFSLGEHLIDLLKHLRKKYDKKTPENTLLKLIINTTYGDSVSRHFKASNMVVGNNITAAVRTAMYLYEIALNLNGSITDGQVFDANAVLHRARGKFLNMTNIPTAYAKNRKEILHSNTCRIAPLNDQPHEYVEDGLLVGNRKYLFKNAEGIDEVAQYVSQAVSEHVRKVFPNNQLLNAVVKQVKVAKDQPMTYVEKKGVFDLELKKCLKRVSQKGVADYKMTFLNDDVELKMRSYETSQKEDGRLKKEHAAYWVEWVDGKLELKLDYEEYKYESPAHKIFKAIEENPKKVPVFHNYVKVRILKTNEWSNHYSNKWSAAKIINLGDNVVQMGSITYLSLTQFKFKNIKQSKSWEKFHNRLKLEYGGLGIEIYYLDESGQYLNYERMIHEVDELIRAGEMKPSRYYNRHRHFTRDHSERAAVLKKRETGRKKMRDLIKEKLFPSLEELEVLEEVETFEEPDEYVD